MRQLKILLLGGTGEASALAGLLANDPRFAPMLSLAGRTKTPVLPAIPCRIGGFGGAAGLAQYLRDQAIESLVVATHPFAAQIRRNAVDAARATGTPLLLIERPAWERQAGDRWTEVPDMEQAAAALGPAPRRVLLTIGRKDLAPFVAAPWHDYVIRSVDAPPPEFLPPHARIITARGPFTLEDDRRLLRDARIEWIVTKNSGGAATHAKLAAARELRLPVIMVARPPWPDVSGLQAARVSDAEGALAWLAACHDAASSAKRGV
ncbi:MAG TPA: cobalt-precorrin-6A reductase [Acidocella sp.]|jgi:precorrin-6A/cobalt-precorrin-6A reductase|uniref:cobalt-precorrin-6A reductase n=1 Tax=Acidocella sp. TaxID=50710 RepID=UPI002C4CD791|nr:cobalt-precorrin-6A reductase [Acidocella sp.]HVE22778.1 cobalt-precorrin-6A reductase [Acidocella sp.]